MFVMYDIFFLFYGCTGKSVCRSLFSRSLSISCDLRTKRKREGEEETDSENHLAKRRKSESLHIMHVDLQLCEHIIQYPYNGIR